MPKQMDQEADTIASLSKPKKPNISTTNANAQLGVMPLPTYPEWKSPGLYEYSQWYENGAPNLATKLDPNNVYQKNIIPIPRFTDTGTGGDNRPAPVSVLPTPAGTGMNLRPEDYQNIAGKSAIDLLSMYMPRAEIDSRFPGGVTEEDAMAYLLDNYSWLFPELTGANNGGGNTQPDYPTGGGVESQIPLPEYGGWGGGGYGQGYRDSGLINWRI